MVFIRPMEALAANQIAWLSGVSHSREAKKRAARGCEKSGRYIGKRGEEGRIEGMEREKKGKGKGCTG